jgi:hypothetical protein
MKFRTWMSPTVVCLFAALAMTVQANAKRIIKFDAPNSGTVAYAGTFATGINFFGTITGNVTDNNFGTHGFVGTPDSVGTPDGNGFTNFDAPGADPSVGCTCPVGINDLGAVVGYYIDTNRVNHGFVRSPSGKLTQFDDSEAGTAANQGTSAASINDWGMVTGSYVDNNGASHGFLRTPDGKITNFDDSEAGTGAYQGTSPQSINNLGVVAGYYADGNYFLHGFLRTPHGKFTSFEAPGAVDTSFGTIVYGINDLGVVAGYWFDANYVAHGLLRTPDGKFTSFEAPGAGTGISESGYTEGTFVVAVNLEGATTGHISDKNAEAHSFVAAANGKATTYDIPGQIVVPDMLLGSTGTAINAAGVIAGYWFDANYVGHGYLRIP